MNEFDQLSETLSDSGCAKKQVACGTYADGIWITEVNTCRYEGDRCPRSDLPSGVGYELCHSLHAEARLAEYLSDNGMHSDGIAWVLGHYYACEPCAAALKSVGVREIRVREKCG